MEQANVGVQGKPRRVKGRRALAAIGLLYTRYGEFWLEADR